MAIIHTENSHDKFNALEEFEILKSCRLMRLTDNVISGKNDPHFKINH